MLTGLASSPLPHRATGREALQWRSGGTFGVQFQIQSGAAAQPRDSCYREARVVTGVAPDASAIPNSGIRTQASVAIEVVIGPDGKVLETHIAQSSGSRALDEAALDAARETTYTPKIVCPYRYDRKPAVQKAAPIPA